METQKKMSEKLKITEFRVKTLTLRLSIPCMVTGIVPLAIN